MQDNRLLGTFLGEERGSGNSGSIAILKAFSSIEGIIRARVGEESSRQGFVLTSMSQGLKSLSKRKS